MNAWLTFSLIFLGIWSIIYLTNRKLRKEIIWASIFTTPLGLTEPIFVPEYWSPPSLFNLAANTGFDIESLIFCFAIGGIGTSLYETITKVKHTKMSHCEKISPRHRYHKLVLLSPLITFILLYFFTPLNPIYSASISMAVGAIGAMLCRPDLTKKIIIGSFLFLGLYFIFFVTFIITYPGIVEQVWNLEAISGILVLGVPLEELIFALTFGGLWASYYEHINWYKIKKL